MKLKNAVFYQSVKLWNNIEVNSVNAQPDLIIELEDHLVKMTKEGEKEVIIVPTANLRCSRAEYLEAFPVKKTFVEVTKKEIEKAVEQCHENLENIAFGKEAPTLTPKQKKNK